MVKTCMHKIQRKKHSVTMATKTCTCKFKTEKKCIILLTQQILR